ncbi:DUF7019 family protein [Streptomyces sp. NPDC055078]
MAAAGAAVGLRQAGDRRAARRSAAGALLLSGCLMRRREWMGTVAAPGRYVRDSAWLRHGVLRDYAAELAVFAGVVDGVKLALIGSPDGLVDTTWEAATDHGLDYYLLQYLRQDADSARRRTEEPPGLSWEAAADSLLAPGVLASDEVRMDFLAKPLFQSDGVLVATPVFVSSSSSSG